MLMYIVVHIHAHAPANTYTHKKNKLIKEKYMYTSTLFFDQVSRWFLNCLFSLIM